MILGVCGAENCGKNIEMKRYDAEILNRAQNRNSFYCHITSKMLKNNQG